MLVFDEILKRFFFISTQKVYEDLHREELEKYEKNLRKFQSKMLLTERFEYITKEFQEKLFLNIDIDDIRAKKIGRKK